LKNGAFYAQSCCCTFIIIAMEPESLLGPSFQMSFAAVAALIAAYERVPHQAMQKD